MGCGEWTGATVAGKFAALRHRRKAARGGRQAITAGAAALVRCPHEVSAGCVKRPFESGTSSSATHAMRKKCSQQRPMQSLKQKLTYLP